MKCARPHFCRKGIINLQALAFILDKWTIDRQNGGITNIPNAKENNKRKLNRLADSPSLYLRQHASDLVDWRPWGKEAFDKAKNENKPIFLSIGYSTCHWCHVMSRESFNDEEVARLINENFVPIKVDREERPDIDSIYMAVCQALTGACGWPLTVVLTPDKKPFFAGTYFPKEGAFGRMGLIEILPKLLKAWDEKQEDVIKASDQLVAMLSRKESSKKIENENVGENENRKELDEGTLRNAFMQFRSIFDEENGGFGAAPKFPSPHNEIFLIRYWNRTGDARALEMAERTLCKMRMGGIYDHLGYGFHRYSTDASWRVPHFEKMLYDQAMLALAYAEAYKATCAIEYRRTAEEILDYCLRKMMHEGGFYAAEDAESDGIEGKYYKWTLEEFDDALGGHDTDDAKDAREAYNVTKEGNFFDEASGKRTGENILYRTLDNEKLANKMGIAEDELKNRLSSARNRLLDRREKRKRPFKDEKRITAWNALMLASLAKCSRAFGDCSLEEAARRTLDFLLENVTKKDDSGKVALRHVYYNREAGSELEGMLDDYAFFAWGALEMYELTYLPRYLQLSCSLVDSMLSRFYDEENGGFFFAPRNASDLIVRKKELYDGAYPSGNSVAFDVLLRLSMLTGKSYKKYATELARAFSSDISSSPAAHSYFLCGLMIALGPSREIVIVGERNSEDTQKMLESLRERYLPSAAILLKPIEDEDKEIIERLAPFTRDMRALDGRATAYVCKGGTCKQPTNDIEKMLSFLDK